MKTTKVLSLLALGAVTALTSCQNKGFDNEGGEPSLKGIAITATGSNYEPYLASEMGMVKMPSTRVNESHFQALDSIGVFIYTGSANAISPNVTHSANMLYYTKDGTPNAATPPEWTVATAMSGSMLAGTAYFTTAYYPYKSVSSNGAAVVHTVAADQSSAAVQGTAKALELSDFMWAKGVAITTPSTTPSAVMNFEHRLTKLVLSLQVPTIADGVVVTKLKSIAIRNLNTTATIDLGTGAIKELKNPKDIKPRWLSGNLTAGTVASYEAIVIPQTAATAVVLVEVKVEVAGGGEKVVNYFPPATGLELGGGKKITLSLSSAADIAFTSEVDLVTGQAYDNVPLRIKVANGTAWTLTSSAAWLTVNKAAGTGTGADEEILLNVAANAGAGATPREAILTLSATIGGTARKVTYTAVQNYSIPVVGFPVSSVMMESNSYKLPAVVGNSNWYIKADETLHGVRLSRRNVEWNELTAADTVPLYASSTNIPKDGYMVSGNYYNSNEALYVIVNPSDLSKFSITCNSKNVDFESRLIKITSGGKSLLWAKGSLVADGAHGCRVGAPYDGGLYFQFGSLLGWKGGATGDGSGRRAMTDKTFYGGPTFNAVNEISVYPTVFKKLADIGTTWPEQTGKNLYYFGISEAPYNGAANLADFPGFSNGELAVDGIGDPCTYYLGSPWRLPIPAEYSALVNAGVVRYFGTWTGGSIDSYVTFADDKFRIPACGIRLQIWDYNGGMRDVGGGSYLWSSVSNGTIWGCSICIGFNFVGPENMDGRAGGFPIRCVQPVL